jgi:hypothetical protein
MLRQQRIKLFESSIFLLFDELNAGLMMLKIWPLRDRSQRLNAGQQTALRSNY